MIDGPLLALLAALATGLVTALVVRPVLRWLPEPADGEGKPLYRDLGSRRFVTGCASLAAFAAAVSGLTLPRQVQPIWLVLAVLGVLLAAIDARSTWLPLRLTRVAWGVTAAATLLAGWLGGGGRLLARAGVGAAVAGLLYLAIWLVSRGGFGFGDVRFAPLLGAAGAAVSWRLLIWTLVLGTVVGGGWGLVRLVRRRQGAFPYAPAMLAGAYVACGLSWWS
jgi:leader peptidase (prepilin peptidase)/N-methyltransferase